MIEKLEKAEARFVKLEESLADPEIYKDQESYAALMKERKSLAPIIEKYRAYKARRQTAPLPRRPCPDGSRR